MPTNKEGMAVYEWPYPLQHTYLWTLDVVVKIVSESVDQVYRIVTSFVTEMTWEQDWMEEQRKNLKKWNYRVKFYKKLLPLVN